MEKKNIQRSGVQLSERLGSLGIMKGQIVGPPKSLEHHSTVVLRGLRGPSIRPDVISSSLACTGRVRIFVASIF